MHRRHVSLLLLLVALGGLGLCVTLALQTRRRPSEIGGRFSARDRPPGEPRIASGQGIPGPVGETDPEVFEEGEDRDSEATGGTARQALGPGGEPVVEGDRDELFADSPQRPEPGAFDGPLVREFFADGAPCFEAEQVWDPEGIWVLHGQWTSWFENGQLQEQGYYDHHRETGDWQWWDDNGQQVAQGSFHEGQREGVWTFWYSNGIKQMDARYTSGQGQGLWTLYYDNGQKWAEGQYLEGEIAGYWTIWDEFGAINPERSGVYEKGKRISD